MDLAVLARVLDVAEMIDEGLDRSKWLQARAAGLGSSDASSVIGWNPYSSPMSVYADKLGMNGADEDSAQARFGRMVEPWLLEEFEKATGHQTWANRALFRSRSRPWQMATPDGFSLSNSGQLHLVEEKSTIFDWGGEIPPDVWCQVQHQLLVVGLTSAFVIVLNRDTCEISIFPVGLDLQFADNLIRAEEEFWTNFLEGRPPNPDGSMACRVALRKLYPEHQAGTWVNGGPELLAIDQSLQEAKMNLSEWEKAVREIENDLISRVGTAEGIRLPNGWSYSYRTQTRKAYTVAETTFRVLRRHKPGASKKTTKQVKGGAE